MAKSAQEALKKEKNHPVDDVWVDEEWKKGQMEKLVNSMGFKNGTK